MSEKEFMEKPCQHCPYRNDVKPFLTPERGEELANIVHNPYNTFHCHKTLEYDDEGDGETFAGASSKICAGFLTLISVNCYFLGMNHGSRKRQMIESGS